MFNFIFIVYIPIHFRLFAFAAGKSVALVGSLSEQVGKTKMALINKLLSNIARLAGS